MKRCPTCRNLFSDTPFRFCRADGAELIQEQTPPGDAPTVLFSTTKLDERFPWLLSDAPLARDTQQLDGEIKIQVQSEFEDRAA